MTTRSARTLIAVTVILALSGVTAVAMTLAPSKPTTPPNLIGREDSQRGTATWPLEDPALDHEIEGYASQTSVPVGGTIELFVNSPAPYTMSVYRMGWYQGLGARLVAGPIHRPASEQPTCVREDDARAPDAHATGLIECNWQHPHELRIARDWVSGVYLTKLHNVANGKESYIIFTVRDGRAADLMFQQAVTTYQAYNNWPADYDADPPARGYSSYDYNSVGGGANYARMVSFDRPYGPVSSGTGGHCDGRFVEQAETGQWGVGAGDFLTHDFDPRSFEILDCSSAAGWEYNMIRWLEREGYDVTYVTDLDTHEDPTLALRAEVFLSVGHDEYWSNEMRTNVENARDQGVDLGFFGANYSYWVVRFEPNSRGEPNRVMATYKEYPAAPPKRFEDPYFDTPQWGLTFQDQRWSEEDLAGGLWGGNYEVYGRRYFGGEEANADLIVSDPDHWIFRGTGLEAGDHLYKLIGYEYNTNVYCHPPGVDIVNRTDLGYLERGRRHHVTVYTAPSGAIVFNAATIQWSWGLDDYGTGLPTLRGTNGPRMRESRLDPAVSTITRNVLDRFLSGEPVPPGDPCTTPT
ncbi:MAG: N,N-dimethylformamidase beta subunit family domain-containing protein [Actinomycetota bacterium]